MSSSLLQYSLWAKPLSVYNEAIIGGIKTDIEQAIGKNISVIAYGSHVLDTATNRMRPLDIYAVCKDDFYFDASNDDLKKEILPKEKNINFKEYKENVFEKITLYFGKQNILKTDATIKIKFKDKNVNITPCYEHRYYEKSFDEKFSYIEGVCFFEKDRTLIVNYPDYEYKNFNIKNRKTEYRFAEMLRIMKNISVWIMNKTGYSTMMHPCLIQSLVWNVPDNILQNQEYEDAAFDILAYIYDALKNGAYKKMFEINDIKLLFSLRQKWDHENVLKFICQCKKYIV